MQQIDNFIFPILNFHFICFKIPAAHAYRLLVYIGYDIQEYLVLNRIFLTESCLQYTTKILGICTLVSEIR
jgi:hypothetical protein